MFAMDQVVRAGATTVAAVVKRSVRRSPFRAVSIHGQKRPVAILIHHADVTMAFEIDGPRIALDDLERRFPGRRAEFERIAISDTPLSRQTRPTDR